MRDLTGQHIASRKIGPVLCNTDTSVIYKVEAADRLAFKYLKSDMPPHLRKAELEANAKLGECPFLICAIEPVVEFDGCFGYFMRRCDSGDLLELILRHPIGESAARKIFWRVINALEWLHSHGWAHRCIQPENILLEGLQTEQDIPVDAYLSDLSFAKPFKYGNKIEKFIQPVGSPLYCAPELYRGDNYDHTVDIWAFGATLFVALTGTAPFPVDPEVDRELFLTYADEEEFEMQALTAQKIGPDAIALIRACLKALPEERVSATEIKNHPFFATMSH
jgi:serine/threonine protein kinase